MLVLLYWAGVGAKPGFVYVVGGCGPVSCHQLHAAWQKIAANKLGGEEGKMREEEEVKMEEEAGYENFVSSKVDSSGPANQAAQGEVFFKELSHEYFCKKIMVAIRPQYVLIMMITLVFHRIICE